VQATASVVVRDDDDDGGNRDDDREGIEFVRGAGESERAREEI